MFYNYVFVHSIIYDHENQTYDYFSKGFGRINPTSFTESSKLSGLCTMYSTLMEFIDGASLYTVFIELQFMLIKILF